MTPVSHGKPYAGNPHVRFEEGDSASAEPRRKSLLHKQIVMALCVLFVMCAFGNDSSIAEKIKVAQDGNAQAQFELGKYYANGEGSQIQWHSGRLSVCGENNVTNLKLNIDALKREIDALERDSKNARERDLKRGRKLMIAILGYTIFIAVLLSCIFNLNLNFRNFGSHSVTTKEGFCAIVAIMISFFVFSRHTDGDIHFHFNWDLFFGIPVCLLIIVIVRWQLFAKLRQKAIAGDTVAILEVARRYAKGKGVKRNDVEAMMWYGKVAKQGNPEAANWFRDLAEKGSAQAQYNLGVCYENGDGVEKDASEAMKWYRIASEQGHKDAETALQELQKSQS